MLRCAPHKELSEIIDIFCSSSRKFPYLLKSVRIKLVNGWVQTINLFGVTDHGVTLRGVSHHFSTSKAPKIRFLVNFGTKKVLFGDFTALDTP